VKLKKLICTIIAQPAEALEKQQVDLPILLLRYQDDQVHDVKYISHNHYGCLPILQNKCFSALLYSALKIPKPCPPEKATYQAVPRILISFDIADNHLQGYYQPI
jgi:hypothetical protein